MKNKIGWCSETFNPVIGCKNNCNYCYAKRINDRFKFIKNWDEPEWRGKSFNKKFSKKPQRIFIGSMSDIAFWEKEWMEKVIEKIKKYPQHTFQFLTKFPAVYGNYKFPKNCWLGITLISEMTKENCWSIAEFESHNKDNLKFISFEPLMEKIDLRNCVYSIKNIRWAILGAETGNRIEKIIPKKEWVLNIMESCNSNKIPVYIKDNLSKYYPDLKDKKEFPKEII